MFDGIIETSLEYWLGTDKVYEFITYTSSAKTTIRDVSGFTTHFMVKRNRGDADAAALLSVAGSVSGSFHPTPATNTQKISVTIDDETTDTEIAQAFAHWELKRMDAGFEGVMAFGQIALRRAVHVS